MCDDFVLVVSNCGLCYWAHIPGARLQHIGVIRRKNRCRCAYNWAQGVVHLLGLGLIDGGL